MVGQGSQVKKSCACCERYMDHLRGKMTSFLIIMSANYRHSMTMPTRFVNQFGGEISESIDIESPDGSVYAVKGTKYMNKKMGPQCGWKAFVDAHRIEENDSLLFQHIEKARFKVLILGPDGCEKVFPCAGIRICSSNIQERGTNCLEVDSSHGRTRTNKLSRVRKRVASCQREYPAVSQRRKTARIATPSASLSEESGPDSEGNAEYELASDFDDDPNTNAAPDYVLSRMSILSEEQEEEVDRLIMEIQPETTVFVALMKPSNLKPRDAKLVIPHGYAAAHFPLKSEIVTLQRPGKENKWHTRLNVRKDRPCHLVMGSYWSDFVQDNHLQEGDICIFQPLKTAGTRFTLMVHLIRQSKVKGDEENGNSPSSSPAVGGGTIRSSIRGRTTRSSTKANGLKIVHSSGVDGRVAKAAEVTPIAGRVKEEPYTDSKRHLTDDVSSDSGGPSEAGLYIVSSHAHLSDEQRKKVEDIVGSIQSQVPIYVAVMTKSNVGATACILYFCKRYASKYLPRGHGEHTVTLVRNGKSAAWKVKMHAHKLVQGWRGFVRDNSLKLDDICLFRLTKDDVEMLTMTVYIIRHVV